MKELATKFGPWFLLLLAVGTAAAQSSAVSEAEEAKVLTLENAWNQAVRIKDAKALGPLLVEESIYVDSDGTMMNKEQYLLSVKAAELMTEHIANEVMRAHTFGKIIVVTGICREKGIKNGKPFALRERFVDTWVRRNGAWVCVGSQSTPVLP